MKNKIVSLISGLTLVVGSAAFASNSADVTKALAGSPAKEIPAKVASLVTADPASAPIIAVTAAKMQHKQIALITKAAVAADSADAGKIVSAMIKAFPKQYGAIAIAASKAAPSASKDILIAVEENVPSLQNSIQAALANNTDVSVQSVMDQASISGVASQPTQVSGSTGPQYSPADPPPTIGSSFVPFPGTPASFTPNSTGYQNVPTGGQGYPSP
jgi:hypothetical protein